jgi:PiT family inorganic phosphate transporter
MTATPAHFADVHTQHSIMHGSVEECSDSPSVSSRFRILDAAHYLTAGLTSFARGLNDAPKIIPFLLLVPALTVSPLLGYVYIGTGMGIGGLISGRKVLQTLSHRIAPMSHTDGFLANAITSSLVGVGAWFGLPMSTTHVSATSIVGTGVGQGKKVSWRVVRDIATAWVVTIPAAAFIAALASVVMQWLVS